MAVSSPAPINAWRQTALLCALAFAVRLCVAVSRCDEQELELYTGTFGWALQQGMPLDPERLPIIDHLRGSVLFGLLVVPLQWLLGPQLLALKLLACTWGAAHVALLCVLAQRVLGRAEAWLLGLLVICAPPSYQMVGVLALGSHEAVGLWIALALLVLLSPARGATAGAGLSAARALALGAVCGCGVLFSLQFVVALPAIALAWLMLDPRFPLRARSWFFFPAAAPLLALIPLLSTQGKLVASKPEDHLQFTDLGAAWDKFTTLVPDGLRRSWLYEEQGGGWLSWIVAACLLVGLLATLARAWRREPLALYALAHPLCYSIAHALTDFELNFDNTLDGIGSRYLMPFWPALALSIVYGARALAALLARPAFWIQGLLPVGAGLLGVIALSDPLQVTREPRARGIDVPGFGFHLRHAGAGVPERTWELARELDPNWLAVRPLALEGARIDAAITPAELRAQIERALLLPADGARRVRLAELGGWLARARRYDADEALAALLSPQERTWLWRGAGRELAMQAAVLWLRRQRAPDTLARLLQGVPTELRPAVVEGAAISAGLRVTPYNPPGIDMFEQGLGLGPKLRPIFFRAAGWTFRSRYFEAGYFVPRAGVLRVEALLPADALEWFREGLCMPIEGDFDPQAQPVLPVHD